MLGRFVFLVSLLALGSCAHVPATAKAPAVRLYAMDCGHVTMAGPRSDLPSPCYLIRHPGGDLLWDAGFPAPAPGAAPGPNQVRIVDTVQSQLGRIGLKPDDVEFLSVSHSHPDHIGNAALFAKATWIVDADEYAWMFRDQARTAPAFATVAPLEKMKKHLIEGDGDYDVFGDGSVVVVQTPGHTPGSASLLVRFAGAPPVILVGDLYAWNETAKVSDQSRASMAKIEKLAAQTGARVIRAHFTEDFKSLPAFPEALR